MQFRFIFFFHLWKRWRQTSYYLARKIIFCWFYIRMSKTKKKSLKKKGGARPPQPEPEPLETPVMDHIMGNLQSLWINPELYPRYINQAFDVIGDIDIIEALYREGELGYFFNSLIIDRFRNTIEHDRSNWDLIVNNIRTANTGRIVSELRDRLSPAADVYQENIIRIGRLNPDQSGPTPRQLLRGGKRLNKKKTRKSRKSKKKKRTKTRRKI